MSTPVDTPGGGAGAREPVAAPQLGRALAVYTGLRLLAFLASTGLLLGLGADLPVAVFGGLVISSLTAWFGLKRPRQALADGLEARALRRRAEKDRLRALLDET